MQRTNIVFVILLLVFLVLINHFSCFDEFSEHIVSGRGQISFRIQLTRDMMKVFNISYVRLTIKQGSTTIWGPQDYSASTGSASIQDIPVGSGYVMYAEALDSNYTSICDGQSGEFAIMSEQTTNIGYIQLTCLPTPTATPTATPYITATPYQWQPGDLYSTENIVGNMRVVTATGLSGFTQGAASGEACIDGDETQFTHVLTRDIIIMETEVTRGMWALLKASQDSLPDDPTEIQYGPGSDNPASNVAWIQSILFANLLSVQNGFTRCYYSDSDFQTPIDSTNYYAGNYYCNIYAHGYRLCTEGEWEWACRAGTTTTFANDEDNYNSENCMSCGSGVFPTLEQYAIFCGNANNKSEPVRSKLPNAWNLYDMHGNLWEWCWDWYASYPGNAVDYTGPDMGDERVARGGRWNYEPKFCRSSERGSNVSPTQQHYYIGFRLARTLD